MPILRLYEDVLSSAAAAVVLPPAPRMVFVAHGSVSIGGRAVTDGEAVHGEGEMQLIPGQAGATCWRFELVGAAARDGAIATAGAASRLKLAAALATLPQGDLIWRGDSVGFPPGGCAYLHRHRGPGIRCLVEGGIRIDTGGHSASYGPGGAWYESGPEPVFAQAAADRATRFVRVMILPRDFLGRSSIEYLNDSDKGKPKSQTYKIFVDAPINGEFART
jgi:hypothetical protein